MKKYSTPQETASVFKKVLILFFITILSIYIMVAILFIQYVSQLRANDMAMQKNRTSNFISGIEPQLQEIYNLEANLIKDSRISRLAYNTYTDKYEQSQLIAEMAGYLQSTKSMNGLIEDIIVILPSSGIELSAVSGYNKKIYEPDELSVMNPQNSLLLYQEEHMEMSISYPLAFANEENYIPDYIIRVIFSEDYYTTYLQTFRIPKEEGAFLVIQDKDENQLFASNNDMDQELMQLWAENSNGNFSETYKVKYNRTQYMLVSESVPAYGITLVTYQNMKAMNQKTIITLLMMGVFILVSAGLFSLVIIHTNTSVSKPLRKIMESFEEVTNGNLDIRIYHKTNDEFHYIYTSFNDTVTYIQKLIEDIKEQGVLLQNAELMQLQSQINPHFLYNSFYIIKLMAKNESYDQIIEFVTALAKYYRFINKEINQFIPLSNEVEHMECYIDIQQMRFGDKITVEKEALPIEMENLSVPKLILQPIIENAYNYGVANMLAGGNIWVRYQVEETMLKIIIEDNGGNIEPERLEKIKNQVLDYHGTGIGHALTNIHRRLMLAYGEHCGLELDIGESGGLKVTVLLKNLPSEIESQF